MQGGGGGGGGLQNPPSFHSLFELELNFHVQFSDAYLIRYGLKTQKITMCMAIMNQDFMLRYILLAKTI